ncbi:MAG: OmpW/AlkL family protein [Pseudomonadota bacterium]
MENLLGKAVCAAVAGVAACGGAAVHAQQTSVFESAPAEGTQQETVALKLAAPKRFFARVGYTYIKPNTRSSETKDISGPVIDYGEIRNGGYTYANPFTGVIVGAGLDAAMQYDGISGLGIPSGVKAEAKGAGTPTVELGMFLDEEQKWAVQGYVLAIPFDNSIEGRGTVTHRDINTGAVVLTKRNYLDGKTVVKTKQLPPTFVLNRYFGERNAKWRPSVGVGVTYAIFFESEATDVLNEYSGGKTEVKIKNAFGAGPFVGLQYQLTDNIHISGALGYIKLKTEAKLTTANTRFTAASPVLTDYSGAVGTTNQGMINTSQRPLVDDMLATIAAARGGSLGTYTRVMKTELDPWVFNVSVGYSF